MTGIVAKISETGRITVPASLREAAGLARGGPVVLQVVDGELRLSSVARAMDRARALTRDLIAGRKEVSVEEFLADRRREADREA